MAINPITTDFVAGAILTAAQMNQLPRGVIGFNTATAGLTTVTTSAQNFCTVTFTLATTRQIQLIGNFPLFDNASTSQNIIVEILQTATSVMTTQLSVNTTLTQQNMTAIRSSALAAGTYTFNLSARVSTGTNRSNSGAASLVSLQAIDLGPA